MLIFVRCSFQRCRPPFTGVANASPSALSTFNLPGCGEKYILSMLCGYAVTDSLWTGLAQSRHRLTNSPGFATCGQQAFYVLQQYVFLPGTNPVRTSRDANCSRVAATTIVSILHAPTQRILVNVSRTTYMSHDGKTTPVRTVTNRIARITHQQNTIQNRKKTTRRSRPHHVFQPIEFNKGISTSARARHSVEKQVISLVEGT